MNKESIDKLQLEELRQQIDDIDQKLLQLIEKRCRLSGAVGKIKNVTGIEIIDSDRESIIFERLKGTAEEYGIEWDFIKRIWRLLLDQSYYLQKKEYK